MLPAELTETLKPPESVIRLGVFLEEVLECPYIFHGSGPVQISLTLSDAENLSGFIAAKYFSPILLGSAWAELVAQNRLQIHAVREFVFWVGRLQQAAYEELYESSLYGQTTLKTPEPVSKSEVAGAPVSQYGAQPAPSISGVRESAALPASASPSLSRQTPFMAPGLEAAAAFGLGATTATLIQNSVLTPTASPMGTIWPNQVIPVTPESQVTFPYLGNQAAFVESSGRMSGLPGLTLPQGTASAGNVEQEPSAEGLQTPYPTANPSLPVSPLSSSVPASVIGSLSQMEPGGLDWLLSQAPVPPPRPERLSPAPLRPVDSTGLQTAPSPNGGGVPGVDPKTSGSILSPRSMPGLFIPALVGAALWLALRRRGAADGPSGGNGSPDFADPGDGAGEETGESSGQPWSGDKKDPRWQRGGPQSARRHHDPTATSRMGFATLFSSSPTFVGQNEGETGSAIEMPLESLVPQGQALTESGMQALTAALPPGASFLYPSLPVGSLGKGSVNVPLAVELADKLIQASSPGLNTKSIAQSAVSLAKAEAPGEGRSAPLAATLVPTVRPSVAMSGGAAEGQDIGAIGSGMGQRPRSLSFLGAPVRLAPSLSGRSELQDEVRAKTGSQLSSQPKPSKPSTFNDLRTQVLGGMPSVNVEPDQQAWAKARPSMGLAVSGPLEVLSGDAWNPELIDVKSGKKDSASLTDLSPANIDLGSFRPIGQKISRPVSDLPSLSAELGSKSSVGSENRVFISPKAAGTSQFGPQSPISPFSDQSIDQQQGLPVEHPASRVLEPSTSLQSPSIFKLAAQDLLPPGSPEQKFAQFRPMPNGQEVGAMPRLGSLTNLSPSSLALQPIHTDRPTASSINEAHLSMGGEGQRSPQPGSRPMPHSSPLAPKLESSAVFGQAPAIDLQLPRIAVSHGAGGSAPFGSLNLFSPASLAPQLEKPVLPDFGSNKGQVPVSTVSPVSSPLDDSNYEVERISSASVSGPAPLPLPKRSGARSTSDASKIPGQFSLSGSPAVKTVNDQGQQKGVKTNGASTTGIDSHEVNAMAMEVYSILRRRLSFEAQRSGR